jgi:hypothetical protein
MFQNTFFQGKSIFGHCLIIHGMNAAQCEAYYVMYCLLFSTCVVTTALTLNPQVHVKLQASVFMLLPALLAQAAAVCCRCLCSGCRFVRTLVCNCTEVWV